MTQEALRLALEALEKLWSIIDDIDTYGDMAKADDKLYRTLVERRQRMRFKETGITTDGYKLSGGAITAIKEALREHAMREVQRLGQEPVKYSDYEPDGVHHNKPPQRTWIGLTDKEMYKLWLTVDEEVDRMAFGKAVEAKLKEKNT